MLFVTHDIFVLQKELTLPIKHNENIEEKAFISLNQEFQIIVGNLTNFLKF